MRICTARHCNCIGEKIVSRKSNKPAFDLDHELPVILDRVREAGLRRARSAAPSNAPNRKWIADFTYVWTAEGWFYVAAVIDLFSRRVVGWSMNAAMTAQLVTDALVMAIWRRGKPDALLHHSDRGTQYTSEQFQRLMADHGVVCSMSRSGMRDMQLRQCLGQCSNGELLRLWVSPASATCRRSLVRLTSCDHSCLTNTLS